VAWRCSGPLRGTVAIVALAAAVIGGWVERNVLLQRAASLWIISDPITQADAIVVLGGNFRVRPRIAAALYHQGLAGKILVSQAADALTARKGGIPTDAELNRAALLKLGVPTGSIESFGIANSNTREEAVALREWAERNNASKFIVPSEIFSARRVRWIFRHELSGAAVSVEVLSFDPPDYARKQWWKKESGVIAFQSEIVKYLIYRAYY
jgi:uncharacterized SAM-binding protein YcdF (DUF218 family)